jgi:ribose transport system substrate-binding protein
MARRESNVEQHRKGPRWRAVVAVGAVAAMVSVLAACSSSGGSSTTSSTPAGSSGSPGPVASSGSANSSLAAALAIVTQYSNAPTAIQVATPLKVPAPKGKTLIYLTQGNVPGAVRVGDGEKAAAAAIGWNYSQINYDISNPATLQSALSTALIKHPTVVSLTGADPSQIGASSLAAYAAAGVPIVDSTASGVTLTKTTIGDPGGDPTYLNYAKLAAAWFVVDSQGKGKALVANVQGITILKTYANAFVSEVQTLCPTCAAKIVPIPIASALGGGEQALVVSALRSNPSYKYVFYDDGDFAIGINSALSAAGLTGIKIGGSDFQPEQAKALAAGTQSVWTGENLINIGYSVVDIALRWVEGMPMTEAANPQPTQLLTKDNIGSQTIYEQPAGALDQWKKLWQVS